MTGASVPCWESAITASAVMRGARRRGVDDEDQRLVEALDELDGGAGGAQIMRARARRDDDEIGEGDDFGDGRLDGGRRVDHQQLDAELAHALDVGGKPARAGAREERGLGRARVPPFGQAALRVGVDERHRAEAGAVGLDGEMPGHRCLARPALLGRDSDNVHMPLQTTRPALGSPRSSTVFDHQRSDRTVFFGG